MHGNFVVAVSHTTRHANCQFILLLLCTSLKFYTISHKFFHNLFITCSSYSLSGKDYSLHVNSHLLLFLISFFSLSVSSSLLCVCECVCIMQNLLFMLHFIYMRNIFEEKLSLLCMKNTSSLSS